MERAKFVTITRVIDPKSRIHYLDAIDEKGQHWIAQMSHTKEAWLCYTEYWVKDAQMPYDS